MKIHHPTQPGYTRFMRLAFAVGLMFIVMAGPALADWEPVGMPGFSPGTALFSSLVLDASGVPYVAYEDMANGQKATVMAFDGSQWNPVGAVGFSTSGITAPRLLTAMGFCMWSIVMMRPSPLL